MSFLNSTDEVAELLNNPEALLTFIEEADKINQQTKHIFDFIGDESVWSRDLYEVLYPDSDLDRLDKAAWAAAKIEEDRFNAGFSEKRARAPCSCRHLKKENPLGQMADPRGNKERRETMSASERG